MKYRKIPTPLADLTAGTTIATLATMPNVTTLTDNSLGVAAATIATLRSTNATMLSVDAAAAVAQFAAMWGVQQTFNTKVANAIATLNMQINTLIDSLRSMK